ncbi:FxLYD domain-containing protein [Pelosinus propionicus]|uniref:FxLYD domain-containing protein n=1 Tax=Pelosinus propionicus TaxID=380084 RepID=UPI002481C7BE|nr:FxLYD domain-containing protein [Pelosinus propionicus]
MKNISSGDRRKISVTFLLYQGKQIGTAININPMLKSGTVWNFTAQVQNAKVSNFELAEINYQ